MKINSATLILLLITFFLILLSLVPFFLDKKEISSFLIQNGLSGIALLISKENPELTFAAGNYYFGGVAYDLNKAKGYFKKTTELDDKFSGAHYQLARVYFIKGDLAMALGEINKELEYHPDFKRSYYVRGLIYGYSKLFSSAADDFKEFLKWAPESWAGWNDLSWVYFSAGEYEKAKDAASEGLKFMPGSPWLLNSLGVALLNLGDKFGAKDALQSALDTLGGYTPDNWGASYPGNDPRVYERGLSEMRSAIERNLTLLNVDNKSTTPLGEMLKSNQ